MFVRIVRVGRSPYDHLREIAEDAEFEVINEINTESDENNLPVN